MELHNIYYTSSLLELVPQAFKPFPNFRLRKYNLRLQLALWIGRL